MVLFDLRISILIENRVSVLCRNKLANIGYWHGAYLCCKFGHIKLQNDDNNDYDDDDDIQIIEAFVKFIIDVMHNDKFFTFWYSGLFISKCFWTWTKVIIVQVIKKLIDIN